MNGVRSGPPMIVGLLCGREYSFPPAFIARVNEAGQPHGITAEMVRMNADPAYAQRLVKLGADPQSSTPAGLSDYMRRDSERWGRVINALKAAGTRFD